MNNKVLQGLNQGAEKASMGRDAETLIFGFPEPKKAYTERPAAYVVIVDDERGKVAMVKGSMSGRPNLFLPGGGSLPGEAPEETVIREVAEELARRVRLTRTLGEVTQYFYADSDNRHYKMQAVFFAGEFTDQGDGDSQISGENELCWLPLAAATGACFHACHAWAVRQVLAAPS